MKTIAFYTLLLYSSLVSITLPQNKTVSIIDMMENFRHPQAVQGVKQMIEGFEVDEAIIATDELLPPSLREIREKDYTLEWKLVYTSLEKSSFKQVLALVNIKGENAKKLIDSLAKEYGTINATVTGALYGEKMQIKGIPANWYSGKVTALMCPVNYFGEIVSGEKCILTISKGDVLSQKHSIIKKGELQKESKEQHMLDGCWNSNLQYRDLKPLENFVNQKKFSTSISSCSFPFLIVTDNQGKETGYLLEEIKEGTDEMKLAEQLLECISQLPNWSFGWLETITGEVFQGRYLKANYSREKGWQFEDFLPSNKL